MLTHLINSGESYLAILKQNDKFIEIFTKA